MEPLMPIQSPAIALLSAVIGYLLGAISFTRIVGHFAVPGSDLSYTEFPAVGTGEGFVMQSVSATSISARVGPRAGCLTSILDILKLALPALVLRQLYPGQPYFLIAAAMGVVGHNWPVYHRFRGGRGMSPIVGGMLVIDWAGLIVTNLLGMVIGIAVFRDVLLAYTSGTLLLVPWLWFRTHQWQYVAYALVVNAALWLALLPELRLYVKFRREGNFDDLGRSLENSDMGRGLLRVGRRLGLVKEKP